MADPLVSVITTVYNCERYIKASLESIIAQDFTNFEIILVNDGSTDRTWEIAQNFKDNRIIFCDNKENKKIPIRRNEAINRSVGKYIAIHDGDDISLPDRLSKEVVFMEEHENIFCIGSYALKIDTDDILQGFMVYPPSTHNEIVMLLQRGVNPIIDPTTIFRRKDFIDLGGYTMDESLYTVPDLDLWARAILYGKKFRNIKIPLIKYRINPDGVTRKHKTEMIIAHRKVVYDFIKKLTNYHRKKNDRGYIEWQNLQKNQKIS